MNSVEVEKINPIGIASIQQNDSSQTKSVNESMLDTQALPDVTPIIQATPALQSTLANDGESVTSEVTSTVTSERNPNCIPPKQSIWRETTSFGVDRDVAFGNSHINISEATASSSSRETFVPYCESSAVSKDVILNPPEKVNSRASINAVTKGNLISGHSSSTMETTTTVLRDTTTTMACRNLEDNAGNKDTAATPEFSSLPLIVQGYMGSVLTGRISNFTTYGERISSPLFEGVFNSLTTRDTPSHTVDFGSAVNFVDTTDTKATSSLGNGTPEEKEISISLEDACLASEGGEKNPSREASLPRPENINVLSEKSHTGVFVPDTSTDMETFPAACQLSLVLVSESTTCLTSDDKSIDSTFSTADREDNYNSRYKTDSDTSRQTNSPASFITPTASTDEPSFFSDNNFSTCGNTATIVSSGASKSTVTSEENGMTSANIIATCLDSTSTTGSFSTLPAIVCNTTANSGTTADLLKSVSTTSGNTPTSTVAEIINQASPSGKPSTILPSGTLTETSNPREDSTTDSENSHFPPRSISSFGNTNTLEHKAVRGFGNGRDREVMIVSALESGHQNEHSVSPEKKKGSRTSHDFHNVALQEVLGDNPAVVSFEECPDNPASVGIEAIAMEGPDCASNIDSERANRTISDQKAIQRHKPSSDGLSKKVIFGNNTGFLHRDLVCSFDDDSTITVSRETSGDGRKKNVTIGVPGFVTATPSSQITTTYSARTEFKRPSEITIDKATATAGNAPMTYEVMPNKNIAHVISTNADISEPATEVSTKKIKNTLKDHDVITSGGAAISTTPEPIADVTSEKITTITSSGEVIRSVESEDFGNGVATATTSAAVEMSTLTSFDDRDTVPSTTEDIMNVISENVPTSDAGDLLASKNTPLIPGKVITGPGKDINNFMAKNSDMTVTSEGTSGSNKTGDSEIISSPKEDNIITFEYEETARTPIGKLLPSEHSSISSMATTSSRKINSFRECHNTSDETVRIQASTNHGGNEVLEELIIPVQRPISSADITSGILTVSREQPSFDSPSTCGDTYNEILGFDSTSGHNIAQDISLRAAAVSSDSNPPSDIITVVPENIPVSLATNVSLLSGEKITDMIEDATVDTDNSLLMNTNNTGDTFIGVPVEMDYGEGITSVHTHCRSTRVLGHSSIPYSSSSVGTNTQETSMEPEEITNAPESVQLEETDIWPSEQESNFSQTLNSRSTPSEATTHSERTLKEDTSGNSSNSNDTLLTPIAISHKDVDSLASDSCITDILPTPEDTSYIDASKGVCSVLTSRNTTFVMTSVQTNTSTTIFGQPTTDGPPRDDVNTTPATKTTTTITAPREPVPTTQTYPGKIAGNLGDQHANTLQDTQNLGEIVTSENIVMTVLQKTEMHCGISTSETRTLSGIHILENISDPVVDDTLADILSNNLSDYYASLINVDAPVIAGATSPLRDSIFASDSTPFGFKGPPRSEGILTGDIPTATSSFRKQITVTETPASAPDMFSLAAREDVTTIIPPEAQVLTEDPTMSDNRVTNITSGSGPEIVTNKTNPLVSTEEPNAATFIPCEMATLALAEKTLSSHDALNGESSVHSENWTPTEEFSTVASTLHGVMGGHLEESSIPSLGTVSTLEKSPSLPESSSTAALFVEETHVSFSEDTSMPTVTASIPTSADLSNNAITTSPTTTPRRTSSDGPREMIVISDPEYTFTTLEDIMASTVASVNSFPGPKYSITAAITSGDITIPENPITDSEDNSIDFKEPNIDSTPGGIHIVTVITPTEAGMLSACDTICTSVASLASSHTFDTVNTAVAHPGSPTSVPAGLISASENTSASGGTITSRQITTTSVFEETGIENNASASGAVIMLTESPVTKGDSMTEMKLACQVVAHTASEPISLEGDSQFLPHAAFSPPSEANVFHKESGSLEKATGLSLSIRSSEDSIHEASMDPREIVPVLPSMLPGFCSGGTAKDFSSARTILGEAEVHASQTTVPLQMSLIPGTITATKDANTRITPLDIEKAPASQACPGLEEYPSSEATATHKESTSSKIITTPREDFADKATYGFKQRPESKSGPGSFLDSTSGITVFSNEISTYDTVFSYEDMGPSENASSNKMNVHESITAITTASSTILSSEEIAVSACKSGRPDESLVSGKFVSIHQTLSPMVITSPRDTTILKDDTSSASGDPNSAEGLTHASETTIPTDLEGSPDNPHAPVTTHLDKSNDFPIQESNITMEEDHIINSEIKPRETLNTETKAHIPREVKTVPEDAPISIPGDTSTTTSRKTPNINQETSMTTGENIATFSEEHSIDPGSVFPAALPETDIASTDSIMGAWSTTSCSTLASEEIPADTTFREAVGTITDDHKHILIGSATQTIAQETPSATCETSTIIHRKTLTTISKKTSSTTTSEASGLAGLTEIPTTVSDEAISEAREPYFAALGGDASAATRREKGPLAVIKRSFSASQGKPSQIKPAFVQPCWSVMLISILISTAVLAIGLTMVIYYTTLFIFVTYSTS